MFAANLKRVKELRKQNVGKLLKRPETVKAQESLEDDELNDGSFKLSSFNPYLAVPDNPFFLQTV